MTDAEWVPRPEDVQNVLRTIELYEDRSEDCDNELVGVETGLDWATADTILGQLWRADRIECRAFGWTGYPPLMKDIRRVIPGRERRWGEHGRYGSR